MVRAMVELEILRGAAPKGFELKSSGPALLSLSGLARAAPVRCLTIEEAARKISSEAPRL